MSDPNEVVFYPRDSGLDWVILGGLIVACLVVILFLIGVFAQSSKSDEHLKALRADWDRYTPGATVARICADGSRVYKATDGTLFVAQNFPPAVQFISSPLEQVCSR